MIPQHKHTRRLEKIGLFFSGRLVRPFLMMMEAKQGAKKKKNNERRLKDSLEFSDTNDQEKREVPFSWPFCFSRAGYCHKLLWSRSVQFWRSIESFAFQCFPFNFPFFCAFSSLRFFSYNKRPRQAKKNQNLRSIIVSFFCARPLFFRENDFSVCLASHREFCTIFGFGKKQGKGREEQAKSWVWSRRDSDMTSTSSESTCCAIVCEHFPASIFSWHQAKQCGGERTGLGVTVEGREIMEPW